MDKVLGHSEELALNVVEVLQLSHVVMGAKEQHQRCSGYWGSAYQAQGRSKESELSHIYPSKELVIFKPNFKSTAAIKTSATPAVVSFFFACFVLVECFGWQVCQPKTSSPQSVGTFSMQCLQCL